MHISIENKWSWWDLVHKWAYSSWLTKAFKWPKHLIYLCFEMEYSLEEGFFTIYMLIGKNLPSLFFLCKWTYERYATLLWYTWQRSLSKYMFFIFKYKVLLCIQNLLSSWTFYIKWDTMLHFTCVILLHNFLCPRLRGWFWLICLVIS